MSTRLSSARSALIHHWFLANSGGERVSEALVDLLNTPDFFTLVADPRVFPPGIRRCRLTTSFIQRLPLARKKHRNYLPLFPRATESFDLRGYDLVVSSDASTVKGVLTQPETCHVCYCHSPIRYAWNMAAEYMASMDWWKRQIFRGIIHDIRRWDYAAAGRVDVFVANSHHVRRRIQKYYRRPARVIYPPCDVERFHPVDRIGDYYLFVGRLIDYKRPDLAVSAAAATGRRLLVVGDGPQRGRLQRVAGPGVEFLGWVDEERMPELMGRARALIFPGEEDFGIVPVEAQAAGRPVVAFRKGGALETVRDGVTGVFFDEQTVDSLSRAIRDLEAREPSLDSREIRKHAMRFSVPRFQAEMREFLEECLRRHQDGDTDAWVRSPAETQDPDRIRS